VTDRHQSLIAVLDNKYLDLNNRCIQACINKERSAQKELYAQLLPYLNALSFRYLNETATRSDVLQESFVKIFTKITQYDSAKGTFKSWSARILINTCLDYNRKSDAQQNRRVDLSDVTIPVNPEVVNHMENEDLLRFIKCLPEKNYTVFNLYVIDGFSHKEISDLLEIDESVSRKRLSRAKKWLKEQLERKENLNNLHLNRQI